jgi:hypothetical protein
VRPGEGTRRQPRWKEVGGKAAEVEKCFLVCLWYDLLDDVFGCDGKCHTQNSGVEIDLVVIGIWREAALHAERPPPRNHFWNINKPLNLQPDSGVGSPPQYTPHLCSPFPYLILNLLASLRVSNRYSRVNSFSLDL